MAYETGTATDCHNLLDKLRTFLVSAGWTQNYWAAENTGYRLHVNKEAVYANFRSCANEKVFTHPQGYAFTGIGFNASTGYDIAYSFGLQPGGIVGYSYGGSQGDIMWIPSSVLSYYFFSTDNNFDVFVETSSNYFQSFHIGELTKFGSYSDGLYFTGTKSNGNNNYPSWDSNEAAFCLTDSNYSATFLKFNSSWYGHNAVVGNSASVALGTLVPPLYKNSFTSKYGIISSLLEVEPTNEGSTVLLPIYYAAYQNPQYWPLGYIAHARICRGEYIANGQEVVLGSDTWKLFQTRTVGTSKIAIAIKKVT